MRDQRRCWQHALARPEGPRRDVTNPPVRFDSQVISPFDDGWDTLAAEFGELPKLATTLTRDATKSAISWNSSPDIGFDRAVNPYRGCEHGCIYCYARPTHAYLGYSPGLDFETKLIFKPEVAELLEKELRKPGYTARTLALGSNTDPYQPVERTLKLTRSVLQVLDRYNHPVGIVTKSAGVLRDLDILSLDGEAQAGAGLCVGHHAGCRAGPADGAARGDAGAAAARDRRTDAGRRAGGRVGGADDPGAERRRDGEDRRGRRARRCASCGLRAAAPAARAAADVRGLAGDAFPRSGEACAEPDPRDARPAR